MKSPIITSEEIKISLKSQGASLVGIADTTILNRTFGLNRRKLKNYPRAISIGVKLSDDIIDGISKGPTLEYAQHYRDKNSDLDNFAEFISKKLQERSFKTIAIPASKRYNQKKLAAIFPHKTAAILSGLGWIGRSALLISHDLGPRIRFTTVLTNAPLEADEPQTLSECDKCIACVKACPAEAITGKLWTFGIERKEIFDAYKCFDHLEIQKLKVGETICGICINVCPIGKRTNE
ncbi:MAG: 4Fe-4S double cluster binding domain-containing protein [Candidatus Heimdallarchaeaceae archaeon]|jgi:epoxyqueuosine reductase QueG